LRMVKGEEQRQRSSWNLLMREPWSLWYDVDEVKGGEYTPRAVWLL